MSRHGNIVATANFHFPEDAPSYLDFSISYDGNGAESEVDFERDLLNAAIEIATVFRLNKRNLYTAIFDTVLKRAQAEVKVAAGANFG